MPLCLPLQLLRFARAEGLTLRPGLLVFDLATGLGEWAALLPRTSMAAGELNGIVGAKHSRR
jgi:hypothetical protein